MIIYRLKSNKTGLFSKGGSTPSFSKIGKIWRNIGHLKNHISGLDARGRSVYHDNDVVMVTYELVETEVSVTTFTELLADSANRKAQREADRQAKIQKWRDDQERNEYNRLKKKYG